MTHQNKKSVLNVNNLTVGYTSKGKTTVIAKNSSFTIQKGELVGVIGRNGAGKSTLLRTLSKMQPSLKGTIALNSKNINDYTPINLAQTLSLVLTDTIPATNLTVLELVALGRQPYTNWVGHLTKSDTLHVKNAIAATSIAHLQHKKCYMLSDGELQKALIARAIAQNTPLIILDEPTTHLDLYHNAQVLQLLKKMTKTLQKTVVYSTHDINSALQLCDKLVVVQEKKIQCNTPEKLIELGVIDALFPSKMVFFDKNNKSLRLNITK